MLIQLTPILLCIFAFASNVNAMPFPPLASMNTEGPWISHDCPTNDPTCAHNNLVPEEEESNRTMHLEHLERTKRAVYYYPQAARPTYYYPQQRAAQPSYYYPQAQQQAARPTYYYYPQQPAAQPAYYYTQAQTTTTTQAPNIGPPDTYQQNWITGEHNRYRRMVPATDMRMVYWNAQLAASAQAHANTCDFRHSRNRANIGENIWAAPYYNYSDAVGRWYAEVSNPYCGCSNNYKGCCGHYIQLVWAQTNLIGCGYAVCNGVAGVGGYARAIFVCHYNPQGNKLQLPAFTWARSESERCTQCPPDQPSCYQGLCYKAS